MRTPVVIAHGVSAGLRVQNEWLASLPVENLNPRLEAAECAERLLKLCGPLLSLPFVCLHQSQLNDYLSY